MENIKYLILSPAVLLGGPLILLVAVELLLYYRKRARALIHQIWNVDLNSFDNQSELNESVLKFQIATSLRRFSFPILGILILFYLLVRCLRYTSGIIHVKETLGPAGLATDLWVENLRLFIYPTVSEIILISLCGLLYIIFTLWHENILVEIFSRLIIGTKGK